MKIKITTVLNTQYIIDVPKYCDTYHCDANKIDDIHKASHWLLWRYTDDDTKDTKHHIHVTIERKEYDNGSSETLPNIDKLIQKDHIVEFSEYKAT